MRDFKFEDIACWIASPVDPIALENWVGNKLLGVPVAENKEWEKAFKKWEGKDLTTLELILDGAPPEGIVKIEGIGTVIGQMGKPERVEIRMDKQKIVVEPDEILVIPLPTAEKKKIKVKLNGKWQEVEIEGGKSGLIIDTRGRPMIKPTADVVGRERLLKWQKALI